MTANKETKNKNHTPRFYIINLVRDILHVRNNDFIIYSLQADSTWQS